MPFRFGLSPVFRYEWLAATRRWQLYAVRSLFVSAILAAIVLMWLSERPGRDAVSSRQLASIGTATYQMMVFVQITMVLLVAPATTAGAVCLDKARGTLDHILATELSNSEVVLGKLAVRLLPMLGIVASLLPAMVVASLLGGIDPDAIFGAFLVILGTATFACTLAFTLSVWGTKTHEVLFTSYFLLMGWVLGLPVGYAICLTLRLPWFSGRLWDVLKFANPYYLTLAPYTQPGVVGYGAWVAYLAVCLVLSALMITAATIRIRALCQKQAGRWISARQSPGPKSPSRWKFWARGPRITLVRPTLDGNPVLWREWQRTRPSRWMSIIWAFYVAFGALLSGVVVVDVLQGPFAIDEIGIFANVFLVNVGLLLLNVQAAASLSEERIRGSLDVLLTTPISTLQVLAGKWWGAWRILPKLMILPAIATGVVVLDSNYWSRWLFFLILFSGYGATAISVGLACATWIHRPGRAIAGSLTFCVIFNSLVLASMIVVSSWDSNESVTFFVAMAGSLSGTGAATLALGEMRYDDWWLSASPTRFLAIWCAIQYLIAAAFFLVTWATFNRCMGRSSTRRNPSCRAAMVVSRRAKNVGQIASP